MALRVSRIEKMLSQKELAEIVGVSQQTIAKWENGVTTPNHFSHMRTLERVLNRPSAILFPDLFQKYDKVN